MSQGGIRIGAATAALVAGPVTAAVTITYGVAEFTAYGTPSPPVQSTVSVNWPGPIGPLTVRVPPVGSVNVTRVDLSDFTDAGVSLSASGTGRWSALLGFRFTVDAPTDLALTGALFGDSGLGLFAGVTLEDADSGTTIFSADTSGSNFDSGALLVPGVEYSLTYQSNYGLGGGTGQGSLLNLALTAVPEPQAIATTCLAGVLMVRRRRA